MDWWTEVVKTIQSQGLDVALAGSVGASAYTSTHYTGDLDLAIKIGDLELVGVALLSSGWQKLSAPEPDTSLARSAWQKQDHKVNLWGLPTKWVALALTSARKNRLVAELPTLTLPYLVLMKLTIDRWADLEDISCMLGPASPGELTAIRRVVRRFYPREVEDLEQIIAFSQIEFRADV
jgi:hypothetical protein